LNKSLLEFSGSCAVSRRLGSCPGFKPKVINE
jgi:hypothetical protein